MLVLYLMLFGALASSDVAASEKKGGTCHDLIARLTKRRNPFFFFCDSVPLNRG